MYNETFDNGREGFDGEEAHAALSALLSFLCGVYLVTSDLRKW